MSLQKRLKVIEHYKKFFGIKEITEEHQLDIDWAEHLIEQEFVVKNLDLTDVGSSNI